MQLSRSPNALIFKKNDAESLPPVIYDCTWIAAETAVILRLFLLNNLMPMEGIYHTIPAGGADGVL